MEPTEIISKLNQAVPGAVLQKARFGKSERTCAWIETEKLGRAAEALKRDSGLDWLENLSVSQIDDSLVLTYFLRATTSGDTLILRASVAIKSGDARGKAPSVRETWATAAPMEAEGAELFGIDFLDAQGRAIKMPAEKLPGEWHGYPLRKDYVFPQEVYGILHVRPSLAGGEHHA